MTTKTIIFFSFIALFAHGQKLDKPTKKYLKARMDTISELDQKYRWHLTFHEHDTKKVDSIKKLPRRKIVAYQEKAFRDKTVSNKSAMDSLSKLQKKLDSLNAITFIEIIEKYGYPSYKRTHSFTTSALTLHFLGGWYFDKLYPIFDSELKKGNMPADEFARWYDRTQLISRKKQLYGEYDKQFPCVDNIENTNIERKKIGLRPIKKNLCRPQQTRQQ